VSGAGSTRTRAGRIRLVERLDVAKRAAVLLHSKEVALERERVRLEAHAARAALQWHERCSEAGSWLDRARALGASHELTTIIARDQHPATVTQRWQTSMGIVYPGSVECSPRTPSALTSTAALGPTADAYGRALAAAATHAATSAAVERLDAELVNTRRRRRAIEERLLSRLEAALRELDLHLDELDREEALRARIAVEQRDRART
jgi:vacuolar-type H+-ATPase subunit D/Vma8